MTQTACPAEPTSRKEAVLSRSQVGALIADGRTIIIVDGKVLKVDAWLKYHPGGDKAIMHMVGRDATDEVNAYATPSPKGSICKLMYPLLQTTLRRCSSVHVQVPDRQGRGQMEELPPTDPRGQIQTIHHRAASS